MKKERLFLFLSVMGILLLFILVIFQKPTLTGKISSLNINGDRINIKLENHSEIIIFYNRTKIDLNKYETIEIYGSKQTSKNQTTIFVNKIIKK